MKSRKVFVGKVNDGERFYAKQVKKRKKIIIEYEDGSKEEYSTGIVFTLSECSKGFKMEGKHCNTKALRQEYLHGLAHIVMGMLDNEDSVEELFND